MGLVLAVTIAGSLALTPLVKRLASKFHAVSQPDGQCRQHVRPIPVWGGVALFLALALGVAVFCVTVPGSPSVVWLVIGLVLSAGMLCVLGCYDDLYDMRPGQKLLGQIVSSLPVVAAGCYVDQLVLFDHSLQLGWLGIPWSVAWLVLGINALNLVDGMDGLASVVGITIAIALAAIAATLGIPHVPLLALALAGALVGFLVYNLPPARVYLGDSGSMVIGLVLSVLALRVSFQPMTANVTVLMALLYVPLLDTALAVTRRVLSGRRIMLADRGHVHHRLLDRGFSTWAALGLLGGLSLASGIIAWVVVVSGWEILAWVVLGLVTILCIKWELIGHGEWALAKAMLVQSVGKPAQRTAAARKMLRRGLSVEEPTMAATTSANVTSQESAGGSPVPSRHVQVRISARGPKATKSNSADKEYVELLG